MFLFTVEYLKKGETEYTPLNGTVRPFSINDTLDDSLDSGVIMVTGLDEKPDIRPFAMVRITINDGEIHYRYFKAGSVKTVKRRYQQGAYKYDTQIDLIELTKDLERVVCDTMTFTNYLGKTYSNGIVLVPTITKNNDAMPAPYDKAPYYYTAYERGTVLTIVPTQDKFGGMKQPADTDYYWKGPNVNQTVTVTSPTGSVVYSRTAAANASGYLDMETGSITLTELGAYTITYSGYGERRNLGGNTQYTYEAVYMFATYNQVPEKTDWTITSVVDRILKAGKTRRTGIEPQKYALSAADVERYQFVKAPEFYISRSTLFDALMTVGGAIHAIPRLTENNEIEYTRLGGDTHKTIAAPLVYEERAWNADDYCGTFDSTVENMVNTIDIKQGAVTEPCAGDFKTVRAAMTETKINADTMRILTDFPINQVTKLWISIIHDGNQTTADISQYVYEQAEYDALSAYKGAVYPYSKAYALCYKQGDNAITGLNFRITGATNIDGAFANYAIKNIIKQATGIEIADNEFINLGFRVTYIPRVTARVRQEKLVNFDGENELIYNQSGNSVESYYYGEKLRGAAARLGNETVTRTYVFDTYDDIPQTGDLVNVDGVDMYVALVNMSLDQNAIRASLVMTANFNKLSEWVGLDSNYRLYDVSEKQSVDRLMNYGQKCLISHETANTPYNTSPLINEWGLKLIKHTFTQTTEQSMSRPYCAALTATDSEGQPKDERRISLPLSTGAMGNSLYFNFRYVDNYGAGYQALGIDGLTIESKNNRIMRNVPYGDVYGEIENLAVDFNRRVGFGDAASQTTPTGVANTLPECRILISTGNTVLSTGAYDLASLKYPNTFVVKKDSRERLNFTYQLHFVTDDPNIVVGTALTKDNLLVNDLDSTKAGVLYLLPDPLNPLRQTLDLTGAYNTGITIADKVTVSTSNSVLTIDLFGGAYSPPNYERYKAWVILNPKDNTFYIGENTLFGASVVQQPIYMRF